ncbi:MAG TPA: phosphocholine cytidylyltransferase family protein [Planctomycetaceae bacterium]|nr:phosphocholine cytidylyltransferase family protein [Planctomycetaceae bacterium]
MRAIIIGAGRGARLMPTTAETPKCFAEVAGRRILDWTIEAFRSSGIDDLNFIGGYRIDRVREEYPHIRFRHNAEWQQNNILASLFYAEDLMDQPFICCYSDILFTPGIVRQLADSAADIALSVDTAWLARYTHRSLHPTDDAEKVTVADGLVTRIHRGISEAEAHGEYTGVAKFSGRGAALLREHYHRARQAYAGRPFREAKAFEKAYLIHLFQEMIEAGERLAHADTPGGYIEIDTQEDFDYARRTWPVQPALQNSADA